MLAPSHFREFLYYYKGHASREILVELFINSAPSVNETFNYKNSSTSQFEKYMSSFFASWFALLHYLKWWETLPAQLGWNQVAVGGVLGGIGVHQTHQPLPAPFRLRRFIVAEAQLLEDGVQARQQRAVERIVAR